MPKVEPNILIWARETAQFSVEDAAHKLNLSDGKSTSAAEKLAAYESGEKAPSRALLLRMAKQYRRPLLTFYLDKPPLTGDRGEDFRTLPDRIDGVVNAYVDTLIRDIKARQVTVRETLIDADEAHPLAFVGRHAMGNGIDSVASAVKEFLSLDIEDYRAQQNHKDAFRLLREHAEKAGIFVILRGNLGSWHTDIDVGAFRGFALADEIAPFIVINDRDAEAAWSFTLLHELAHIALGETGVSGMYPRAGIEKFCNDVASEILLGDDEFDAFGIAGLSLEELKSRVSSFAFVCKLSSSHIAYRLYRRGDIERDIWHELRDFYRAKWQEEQEKKREKSRQTEGGPNYYVVKNYKMGGLVSLVKRLTYAGAITTTKAGMLLDVRPLKVHKLFEMEQST
ncbi:MAG: XRE family transcriptional regulator [Pseudomonadales bacterium]